MVNIVYNYLNLSIASRNYLIKKKKFKKYAPPGARNPARRFFWIMLPTTNLLVEPSGPHLIHAPPGSRTRPTSFLLFLNFHAISSEAIGNRPSVLRGGSKGTKEFLLLATRYSTDKLAAHIIYSLSSFKKIMSSIFSKQPQIIFFNFLLRLFQRDFFYFGYFIIRSYYIFRRILYSGSPVFVWM